VSFDTLLTYGWVIAVAFVWLALSIGSFLNVVIYRLPVMLTRNWEDQAREVLDVPAESAAPAFNLLVPRSRCGSCGAAINAWQNIPIVSWLLLRGRCNSCAAPISVRYPMVEGLTAIVSIVVIAKFGYTWTGLAALVFTWALIALAFIDLDTKLLPDDLTLPLLWFGLAMNLGGTFTDLPAAVIGAIAGYLVLWSIYWVFKLLTGKEGMGYGDFKLLAAFGAWFGWQALPALVLISSVAGVILGGAWLAVRRSREAIPFGPFLAVAGWVMLIWRDTVIAVF
jgi:leader peptidase (prepilin peptidase)/N-methyltransferase